MQGRSAACTAGGLRAGCTYRVRVCAFNLVGEGASSVPVNISTAADVAWQPSPPHPIQRWQQALQLAWQPPRHDGGSPIQAYRLEGCRGQSLPQPHPLLQRVLTRSPKTATALNMSATTRASMVLPQRRIWSKGNLSLLEAYIHCDMEGCSSIPANAACLQWVQFPFDQLLSCSLNRLRWLMSFESAVEKLF